MTPEGPFIGVLMLDTAFDRVPGDAGNPVSYPMPVRLERVPGAGSLDIVRSGRPSAVLIERFRTAAQALEAAGAVGIVSTCGFLTAIQSEIAQAVRIPVMVSSLSLYPTIRSAILPGRIGILTASSAALGSDTLEAAGIDPDAVEIAGLEHCPAFAAAVLQPKGGQSAHLDTAGIERAAVAATHEMRERAPDLGAILLECGNLPPYSASIRAEAGCPVFSVLDAAQLLWRGSAGERF